MNVDGMNMVIPLSMHATNVGVDFSPTDDGITMASLGLQASSGVPSKHVAFPKEMATGGGVFLSDAYALTIVHPPITLSSEEEALVEE
ncbi:hypothetical protein D8674_010535 [Pyrus ussuriensis x Pyrus communis]|uniref:Uncharacterized protein n=1 Tax=Pyrus ussuriensis x Pyrus communis TaxID=2448454 RepID=A0A5N5FPS8_9ROSA|nr:hypothetical protein D8674_010535 [Pyrus ussuriensis x Pyrus communis]